jgi:TPR repeat protein
MHMLFEILKKNVYARIGLYSVVAVIAGGVILYVRTQKPSPPGAPFSIEAAEKAAESGDKMAQRRLALIYDFGQNKTAKDPVRAALWFRKAAEQDEELSEYNLGTMYMTGEGVQVDYGEALKWLRKAAEHGRRSAYTNLGNMYANGKGVPKDYEEAIKLWRKAAELKEPNAELNLALAYRNGIGVPKNWDEAERWFVRAAEQGNAKAAYDLAMIYRLGTAAPKDQAVAVHWFRAAAQLGILEAQIYLAHAYATGEGIEQNKAEALKWLKNASGHIHFAENLNDLVDSWIANPELTIEPEDPSIIREAVALNYLPSQTSENGAAVNKNILAGTKIKPKRIRRFAIRKHVDHQTGNVQKNVQKVGGDVFRIVELGSGRWRIYERVSASPDRMAGTMVKVRTIRSSKLPKISYGKTGKPSK